MKNYVIGLLVVCVSAKGYKTSKKKVPENQGKKI